MSKGTQTTVESFAWSMGVIKSYEAVQRRYGHGGFQDIYRGVLLGGNRFLITHSF